MEKPATILDYEEIARNVARILREESDRDGTPAVGPLAAAGTVGAPPYPGHDARPASGPSAFHPGLDDCPVPDPGAPRAPHGGRPRPGRIEPPRPPHGAHPPIVPLREEHHRRQRVTLDAEALHAALEQRGLASASRSLESAPAEVKAIAALLLDVPVSFAGDMPPRRRPAGFENPLLAGERFERLAQRLDVEPERLRAELEGAPAEMLAVVTLLADRPLVEEG